MSKSEIEDEIAEYIAERKREILEMDSRRSKQLDELDKFLLAIATAGMGYQLSLFKAPLPNSWAIAAIIGAVAVLNTSVYIGAVICYIQVMKSNRGFYECARDLAMAEINEKKPGSYNVPNLRIAQSDYEGSIGNMLEQDRRFRFLIYVALGLFAVLVFCQVFVLN